MTLPTDRAAQTVLTILTGYFDDRRLRPPEERMPLDPMYACWAEPEDSETHAICVIRDHWMWPVADENRSLIAGLWLASHDPIEALYVEAARGPWLEENGDVSEVPIARVLYAHRNYSGHMAADFYYEEGVPIVPQDGIVPINWFGCEDIQSIAARTLQVIVNSTPGAITAPEMHLLSGLGLATSDTGQMP